MNPQRDSLIINRQIAAPPQEVYRALTNAMALREWLCDAAQADPRPGGRLYLWWNDGYYSAGEFTTLQPQERVCFTWHGRGEHATTRIEILMEAVEEGTRVRLSHNGFDADHDWAQATPGLPIGWETALENLQSILETGRDLRYTRRPLLGITVGELDEQGVTELQLPVDRGIRLDGVLAGLGAEAAGLQVDDVIVSIDGVSTVDWPTLTAALQAHRAGDVVEVVYYRGPERRHTIMELSARQIPEIPEMPSDLAEATAELYAAQEQTLFDLLQGVSEEQAAARPAPDAWNAREILAHLIVTERELHSWMVDLINDDERWSDTGANPTNVALRIQAVLAVYPTVADLLAELQRNRRETVAMLAALPPSLVRHRGTYFRLGHNVLEGDGAQHAGTHITQIREALHNDAY